MPVQDLTPQLRTRLNRLEKWVGVFVTVATLLMLAGLAFYFRNEAHRKGWFLTKAPFFVYLQSGGGIKPGDHVMLMGFSAGEITKVVPEKMYSYDNNGKMVNVYVEFIIRSPNIGYIFNDSVVKVKSVGLLGSRYLEITKGGTTGAKNIFPTYMENEVLHKLTHMLISPTGPHGVYTNYHGALQPYWLQVEEPPDLSAQMDEMLRSAKNALPAILDMTNQLNRVLNNAALITTHLDDLLVGAKPIVANMGAASTNLALISGTLHETKGALGEWLLPTNIQNELVRLLPNVNSTVTNVNTNLVSIVENLNKSLENVAGITSNLHAQVQANTNFVTGVNKTIIDSDDLIQGLKRHWLLRSAFKPKSSPAATNQPPAAPAAPALSPKGAESRRAP